MKRVLSFCIAFALIPISVTARPTPIEDQATFTYEDLLDGGNILKSASNSVVTYSFQHETAPPFALTAFSVQATDSNNPYGIIQDSYTVQRGVTGQITAVVNGTGQAVFSKTYDPAGRLLTVHSGGFSATIAYDGFGRMASISYSDGTAGVYSYDLLNRVIGIQWTGPNPAQIQLQYDAAGNVVQVSRENGSYSLSYDSTDQLTAVTSMGTGSFVPYNRSLTYDALGNRLGDSIFGNGTFVSNFLTKNSYATYSSDPDGFGAVAEEATMNRRAVRQFTYRSDGNLSTFNDGRTSAQYLYDPLGRRIAKVIQQNGATYTQSFAYLGDEDDLIMGRAGDGSLTVYLQGQSSGMHLGEVKSGVGKGYTVDHLGSVLNSNVAGTANMYGFFGEVVTAPSISASIGPVLYGFAGMIFDPETGDYKSEGPRFYDARVGRWTSQEPSGADGPNLYKYAANNPLRFTDPDGLSYLPSSAMGGPGELDTFGEGGFSEGSTTQGSSGGGTSGGCPSPSSSGGGPGTAASLAAGALGAKALYEAGNRGERGKTGNPSGTDNPFKKMVPDPTDPTKVIYKDPHTGKSYQKQKPDGFDDYWKKKRGGN